MNISYHRNISLGGNTIAIVKKSQKGIQIIVCKRVKIVSFLYVNFFTMIGRRGIGKSFNKDSRGSR